MLRSKKTRAVFRRGLAGQTNRPHSGREHWADVWLPRLSHLAQFGLFLFTLGISYFTVLPLFQKAVLEEAIAKKEVELGVLTKSLDKSYGLLRVYAMRQFYIEAMPECGGLFVGRREIETGEPPKRTRAEMIFEIDVQSCLINLGGKVTGLKELRPEDLRTFQAELLKVGQAIAARKEKSLLEYATSAQRVTDADISALPGSSARVRMQEFLEKKMRGGVPDLRARREIAESMAREAVGSQYETFIRDEIRSLARVHWDRSP